jgi:hypothetical protein
MMTRILYFENDDNLYIFPSTPFSENAGAFEPMGSVGWSSKGFEKQNEDFKSRTRRAAKRILIFISQFMKKIKI